ncbi:hypothetical protein M0804_012356 [Polistes exclamans]|nr:hypothetical protein M0804_012356 [Polistes exclamans]
MTGAQGSLIMSTNMSSTDSVTTATTTLTTAATTTTNTATIATATTSTTTSLNSILMSIFSSTTTTTATTPANSKDNKEIGKENKENKGDNKDSHIVKVDVKEESSTDNNPTNKDVKVIMEGKNTLSSGSAAACSLSANTTNVPAMQSEFKDTGKKKTSCRETTGGSSSGINTAATSRIKDKKKENHANPMETSDEEAQSTDTIVTRSTRNNHRNRNISY